MSDFIALLAFFLSLYGAIVSTSLALSENLNLKLKYLAVQKSKTFHLNFNVTSDYRNVEI